MPDLEVPRLASCADCCSESSRCPQENWTCEFLWARHCGRHDSVGVASKNRPIRASHPHTGGKKKEADMLNSMKSGAPEKDKSVAANAPDVMGRMVQPHDQAWARSEPTTKAGTASCIGSDMSIVGKIECNGPAQVLGRIEGELRASDLLISDGAQVEGNIIAQGVTVCGRVKGTIRAVRVKLQNGGAVEGDIFHRSLSIDENSQFEGSSRRVEHPTEPSSSVDAKGPQKSPQKKDLAPAPLPSIDAELTEGPKP